MYAASGAGLAANQVGVDLKVFVYDDKDPEGKRSWGIVCNPVIKAVQTQDGHDGKHQHQTHQPPKVTQALTEGCLSYPGVLASVSRPRLLIVHGVDHHGLPLQINATGTLAQILQHETDHLNGIVYGDHVPRKVREKMDKRYEILQAKKTYPEDWPVSKATQSWEL
jgi:peptide deformylase